MLFWLCFQIFNSAIQSCLHINHRQTGAVRGWRWGNIQINNPVFHWDNWDRQWTPTPSHPQTRPHTTQVDSQKRDPRIPGPLPALFVLPWHMKAVPKRVGWWLDLCSPRGMCPPASPGSVTMHSALLLSPQGHHKPSNSLPKHPTSPVKQVWTLGCLGACTRRWKELESEPQWPCGPWLNSWFASGKDLALSPLYIHQTTSPTPTISFVGLKVLSLGLFTDHDPLHKGVSHNSVWCLSKLSSLFLSKIFPKAQYLIHSFSLCPWESYPFQKCSLVIIN